MPLGDVDPVKELLVLVPGKGMDFRDMQALGQLQDTHHVVILISNHDQPWDHGGRYIAEALQQLIAYRQALGEAQGIAPSKVLRLIGHSAGALTSQAMLCDLVNKGVFSGREDSLFSRVGFWAIDGPWRASTCHGSCISQASSIRGAWLRISRYSTWTGGRSPS